MKESKGIINNTLQTIPDSMNKTNTTKKPSATAESLRHEAETLLLELQRRIADYIFSGKGWMEISEANRKFVAFASCNGDKMAALESSNDYDSDLLEALKNLVETVWDNDGTEDQIEQSIVRSRAAIATAEKIAEIDKGKGVEHDYDDGMIDYDSDPITTGLPGGELSEEDINA